MSDSTPEELSRPSLTPSPEPEAPQYEGTLSDAEPEDNAGQSRDEDIGGTLFSLSVEVISLISFRRTNQTRTPDKA